MSRYSLALIALLLLCAAANSAPVISQGQFTQQELPGHHANVALIVSRAFDSDGKFQESEANRGLECYYSAAGLKFKK